MFRNNCGKIQLEFMFNPDPTFVFAKLNRACKLVLDLSQCFKILSCLSVQGACSEVVLFNMMRLREENKFRTLVVPNISVCGSKERSTWIVG
mmetsp:Transcript_14279/g.34803  ORF Transcript_14279/g.34803 Transcript_14279/m.34803 type:complete len:92 (-) Transcript_14279:504-779(-)